ADVLAGITAALSVGSTSPDVVALEARKATERRGAAGPSNAEKGGRLVVLAEHRSATVPTDQRSLPSVDKYDVLLGRETS
ncbi:MAG: IS21 family transposase, partial [Mycobacterium sp.]